MAGVDDRDAFHSRSSKAMGIEGLSRGALVRLHYTHRNQLPRRKITLLSVPLWVGRKSASLCCSVISTCSVTKPSYDIPSLG